MTEKFKELWWSALNHSFPLRSSTTVRCHLPSYTCSPTICIPSLIVLTFPSITHLFLLILHFHLPFVSNSPSIPLLVILLPLHSFPHPLAPHTSPCYPFQSSAPPTSNTYLSTSTSTLNSQPCHSQNSSLHHFPPHISLTSTVRHLVMWRHLPNSVSSHCSGCLAPSTELSSI